MVTAILAQSDKQGGGFGGMFVLLAMIVAFYFVAIRPGRKRMQAVHAVQQELAPGRQIVTTAGLYATVTGVDESDGTVTLEIAPGVEARFARGAIMKVVDEAQPEALVADGEN